MEDLLVRTRLASPYAAALTSPPCTAPRSGTLSAAEEHALLQRVHRDNDAQARAELVERMLPFVRRIARVYADRGEQVDDLVQVGAIGLLNAIDRFDLDRGLRLSTFAAPNISGEIKRHFRDRAWAVRTPRGLQELHATLRTVGARFTEGQGREPTVGELCELTGRSEEHVLDAINAGRNYRAASLDRPRDEEGGSLGDAFGCVDHGFERAEQRATLERGLSQLGERERKIVLLRFVEGLSQREIAAQIGVSQMHVSRLLRQSIELMRQAIT